MPRGSSFPMSNPNEGVEIPEIITGAGGKMMAPPKPTPMQAKYLALVRGLTEASTILVVKVATCKCDKKEQCKVYLHSQKMAELIDQLGEIRLEPETSKTKMKRKAGGKSG